MPDLLKIYWDSCVFLSYINGDEGRLPDIDNYLGRSGNDHQIVTSVLSVIEVAFGKEEQDGHALQPETEEKINALWYGEEAPVILVEFYPQIAEEAKALVRAGLPQGWSLKAADAMHLATAKRIQAAEIHTYEEKWLRYHEVLGIKIGPPKVPNLQLALHTPPSPAEAIAQGESKPAPTKPVEATTAPAAVEQGTADTSKPAGDYVAAPTSPSQAGSHAEPPATPSDPDDDRFRNLEPY